MNRVPRTRTNIPISQNIFPNPQNEREDLMNKLHALGVLVPGAYTMPIDQLRGITAWQTEKAQPRVTQGRGMSLPDGEIKEALREILLHKNRRR